jgi:hypothetical protein
MSKTIQNGQAPRADMPDDNKPKPGIGLIHYLSGWIIDLLDALSFLLLVFVGVLTVASAFQGGHLIQDSSLLTQGYSWSLGIGIEGQLSVMCVKAVKAGIYGRGGQAALYWFVAFILFVVSVATGGIVVYQEAYQVTFNQALQAVGVPLFFWDWGRVVTMYGLIVLGSATRYVKPKPRLSEEEELAEIARQGKIIAAKSKNRAAAMRGMAGIVRGAAQGALGREDEADIPEEAPAFAQGDTGDNLDNGQTIPREPPPINLGGYKGKYWDAQSYKDFVAYQYSIGITLEKATQVVGMVGNQHRVPRPGVPGKAPLVATIARLKAYAAKEYKSAASGAIAGDVASIYSE